MALFDAYLVVDWSAETRPKTGADSVWYAVLRRTPRGLRRVALANPPTRAQAYAALRDVLKLIAGDGTRVLAGFDFPNAYPRGFARAAGFRGTPWRATWDGIAGLIEDGADNANNRFAAAAELNRRISGGAFPFWGCPAKRANGYLSTHKPKGYGDGRIAERRLCELRLPRTHPCWKLYTTGSVGGQALTGIPVKRRLRDDPALSPTTRVWPFETGLAIPPVDARIVLAEVWPSLIPVEVGDGEVKDALQVESTARWMARRDEEGLLAADLAGPDDLNAAARRLVEREEGWILGAGTARRQPFRYERRPEAITRRSFAIVRREADLSALPGDVREVATRLVHSCGMTDIVGELAFTPDVAAAARAALRAGAPVLCDSSMVAAGIMRLRLPAGNRIVCTLGDRRVAGLAKALKTTRSAAAVDLWRRRLGGAMVAIGNAPTALYRLLELLREGAPRPAAILAFPVGFVGAAESKQALVEEPHGVPYLTLLGRRGGSALAAAAVNAVAE